MYRKYFSPENSPHYIELGKSYRHKLASLYKVEMDGRQLYKASRSSFCENFHQLVYSSSSVWICFLNESPAERGMSVVLLQYICLYYMMYRISLELKLIAGEQRHKGNSLRD